MTADTRPRRTVLIAGPPCSGKTTLADRLARPGDLIVDFDRIARELGSPAPWLHSEPYRSLAEHRMREILAELPGPDPGTAYVVRAAPIGQRRAIAARTLRATTCYLLTTTRDECERRAHADQRPPGTHAEIARWYAAHTPWSGDTTPALDDPPTDAVRRSRSWT